MKTLISWIGNTDLKAVDGIENVVDGPIMQAVNWESFDQIVLLSNHEKNKANRYVDWLKNRCSGEVILHLANLSGPTEFGEIYQTVVAIIRGMPNIVAGKVELTFHLSPGTPAMSAVWIIVSKTRYPARLIESSRELGVRVASVPFDISADFVPDLMRRPDRMLEEMAEARPNSEAEFEDILYRSPEMQSVVEQAKRTALRSIPVLIEGESGTGKELMARAIHNSSPRRDKPFVAINCGAIPENLLESELFGHKKGAFTGANADHKGHFEEAEGGTVFLDEIGELPLIAQVKLLRVLQEKEVQRLGDSKTIKIDVRIISATNRNLADEVRDRKFREDLFYRLAVAIVRLPALRDRSGDVSLLTDYLINIINDEGIKEQPGYKRKKISANARNVIIKHSWPGNIRELFNTLQRAAVWNDGDVIDEDTISKSIFHLSSLNKNNEGVLNRDLTQPIDIQDIIGDVAKHYINRALSETHGNKTKAALLLGLSSHQTLNGWIERYGI